MKRTYFFLLAIILLLLDTASCSKEDHNNVVMASNIDLAVQDTKGNDLLNPAYPQAININNKKFIILSTESQHFFTMRIWMLPEDILSLNPNWKQKFTGYASC